MLKKLGFREIGFADSEFESFQMNDRQKNLKIFLTSWDERELCLIFSNPIHFSYTIEDGISELYEIQNKSELLDQVLAQYSDKIDTHQFKLFQLWDKNDFPFINVVAESVNVTKSEEITGFRT